LSIVILLQQTFDNDVSNGDTFVKVSPRDSINYEAGFLERLDAEGHAIEKHVGKSDAYLRHRLKTEDIPAASTFEDMTEAEDAIRTILVKRQDLIETWFAKGRSRKKAFYYPMAKPTGRVLKREWDTPRQGNQARVVLIRDTDYPEGFFILTAYPEVR
jgi:hypothetical protein